MEKEKVIESLQGKWYEENTQKLIEILDDLLYYTIDNSNNGQTIIGIVWDSESNKWQITGPGYFWPVAYIEEISDNILVVHNCSLIDPNKSLSFRFQRR